MRRVFSALLLSGALFAAACNAAPPSSPAADPGLDPLATVARGTAMALGDTEVRRFVIDAMRGSPWVEHKVSLHELMAADGSPIRRRAATSLGMSEEALSALVARLPEMDFYLAVAEQRRNWTEDGAAVTVAASADHDRFVEYDETGRGTPLAARTTDRPVFAIHPAERQAYRVDRPAAVRPGAVIEDAGDGAGGLLITSVNKDGLVRVLDVGRERLSREALQAYLRALAGGEGSDARASGRSAVAAGPFGTRVAHFATGFVTDGLIGTAEIELKAWQTTSSGTTRNRVQFRWEGVEPGHLMVGNCIQVSAHPSCIEAPLSLWTTWYPGMDAYLRARAEMMETDTGDDDSYGSRYWYYTDNGVERDFATSCMWAGYPEVCGTATLEWN